MKSISEGYTEEEIRKRILEKPERKTIEPPPLRVGSESRPTAPTDKPETIKPLIDIKGNQKIAESKGLTHWAKLQNLKNSAAAFNLMREYGGMEAFLKLLTDCRNDVATIENGIAANNEQIKAIGYLRDDIKTYQRTKPIYKEYEETKYFKERFLKKHESDITAHELAVAELRQYPKPLPTAKTLDERIAKLKAANVNNHKALTPKKAELKQLSNIHSYLYHLKLTHEPPPPPREQEKTRTRKRSNDLDR
jgi:hypothetical protein